MKANENTPPSVSAALAGIILFLMLIAAWFTHVISCILQEQFVLLVAGAVMAPIAVIHGFGIWFGLL